MFELFTIIAVPIVILALIIAGIVHAIRSRKQEKANTNRVTITITNSSNNDNTVKTTVIQDGDVKHEQSSEI